VLSQHPYPTKTTLHSAKSLQSLKITKAEIILVSTTQV
jgi:hypothetical protein